MSAITTYPLNGIDYDDKDVAAYESTRTSGVYSSDEDYAVTAAGGLTVTVSAGRGWIHPSRFTGYSITKTEPDTLTLPLAEGTLPRIDRVVLRYSAAARATTLLVLTGAPASNPAPPEITRTELIYDLCLAQITRPAGSTAITAAQITDTRTVESLCGVMRDGVEGIPTGELLKQWQAVQAKQDADARASTAKLQQDLQADVDAQKKQMQDDADALQTELQAKADDQLKDWKGKADTLDAKTQELLDEGVYSKSDIDEMVYTKEEANEAFPAKDAVYTKAESDAALAQKSDTGHTHSLNTLINALTTGTATPGDEDYIITQYVGGGETTKTYHRRPLKALWAYIKAKTDALYAAAKHTHLYAGSSTAGGSATSAAKLDTTTAGSATKPVYFKDGKPVAGTYELKKTVPSDAVFTDHTYAAMKGATSSAAGSAGLVPAPASGAQAKYLRGDGTWQTPPDTNTTYSNMTGASSTAAGKAGLVPAPASGKQAQFLRGDGTWATPTNTTYSNMTAATSSAAGKAGLVPAPGAGAQAKFLRGDGTWQTPTNTTYSAMTGASSSAAGKTGLVPAPAAGAATRYLRSDGTWQVPPDHTYSAATASTSGLMTAAQFSKLAGIATGATGSDINALGSAYIRFNNGLQICWGSATSKITKEEQGTVACDGARFPVPFVNTSYYIMFNLDGISSDKNVAWCRRNIPGLGCQSPTLYLAIGKWK